MKEINGVKLYTKQELAELLGVTENTIGAYIRKGNIAKTKFGGRVYASEQSLLDFLNGRTGQKPEPKEAK